MHTWPHLSDVLTVSVVDEDTTRQDKVTETTKYRIAINNSVQHVRETLPVPVLRRVPYKRKST
jgi:hypothetical protein